MNQKLLNLSISDTKLLEIVNKFNVNERLTPSEALYLFENSPLALLSMMALERKKAISGDKIFYNRNFHIEPTNICIYNCKFCSFRQGASSDKCWNMNLEQFMDYARQKYNPSITEIHLVGGVHPDATLESYGQMVSALRKEYPTVSIKAFSAIEHIYVYEKAAVSYKEGVKYMKNCGMDSITGGGAEIFDPTIRQQICPDKPSAEKWLNLHKEIHKAGMQSACTMLYGHIEGAKDIIDHLNKLRNLQDETSGFTTFIPLKYRAKGNNLTGGKECAITQDLRVMAISRIFLDNIDHLKAYPPALGVENSRLALLYGADDIDGTVNETTKIYTMAGGENLQLTEQNLKKIAQEMGFKGKERDTFYKEI